MEYVEKPLPEHPDGRVPGRPPGRPRGFSLEAALDRAIPVFWEKGYDGASYRDLTAAMGISAPSLVAAFGDKRGLFDAAVARYAQTAEAKRFVALQDAGGLRESLAAFFGAVIAGASGEGHPTGCLVTCALADVAGYDAAARGQLAMLVAAADESLARLFTDAGFPAEEARRRAQIAVAMMQSLTLRARAGAPRDELQKVSDTAVRLLCPKGGCTASADVACRTNAGLPDVPT